VAKHSAILFEWYLWFYRTGSPCPEGMFGAIRTKRELSMRMLDDLSAVLHFIEYLRDRRRPPSGRPDGAYDRAAAVRVGLGARPASLALSPCPP
jgi:hypothetical protein